MIEFERIGEPGFVSITEAQILDMGERAMERYLKRATERVAQRFQDYSGPGRTRHMKNRSGEGGGAPQRLQG